MFKLRCEHCGIEMIVPKSEKMMLVCERCGGHLGIIEDLSKEELVPCTSPYVGHYTPNKGDGTTGDYTLTVSGDIAGINTYEYATYAY